MKTILLFGAGKSATACIEFLGKYSENGNCRFIVADADLTSLQTKTKKFSHIECRQINILDGGERLLLIREASVVISMLPPTLHILVAKDCVLAEVHLLTASYLDEEMLALKESVIERKLTFICELGLDPGIDHMSAMNLISSLRSRDAKFTSFKSHCGGLVAEESDDNPWHYKISWNPKNIVNAGKLGGVYLHEGQHVSVRYKDLFKKDQFIKMPNSTKQWNYYANRDSLAYIQKYEMQEAENFIRTTLRHPVFIEGWQAIVHFQFTNEDVILCDGEASTQSIFSDMLSNNGQLQEFEDKLVTDKTFERLINFLELWSPSPLPGAYANTVVELLQKCMEKNLILHPDDKDLIVMVHEIEYLLGDEKRRTTAVLEVKGCDSIHTAMAKTVGLPLAIAAKLLVEDNLDLPGLHIPVHPEIYELILPLLAEEGIAFEEYEENV